MKPRIASLPNLARFAASPYPRSAPILVRSNLTTGLQQNWRPTNAPLRSFLITRNLTVGQKKTNSYANSNARPAEDLNHNVTQEEKDDYEQRLQEDIKEKQIRTPWHREGSEVPPVARQRSAGAMTKGSSYSSACVYRILTWEIRKAIDNTFTHAQTHIAIDYEGHEHRSQRR